MSKKREYMAIVVLKERQEHMSDEQKRPELYVMRTRYDFGDDKEKVEGGKAILEAAIESRLAKVMDRQEVWGRVTDLKELEKNRTVIAEGIVDYERVLVMVNIPKHLKREIGKNDLWDMLRLEQKLGMLETTYPHIDFQDILVDIEDWRMVEESVEVTGISLSSLFV